MKFNCNCTVEFVNVS